MWSQTLPNHTHLQFSRGETYYKWQHIDLSDLTDMSKSRYLTRAAYNRIDWHFLASDSSNNIEEPQVTFELLLSASDQNIFAHYNHAKIAV